MGQVSFPIPQSGQPNATEDAKVANGLTILQALVNGNIDGTNLSALLAQAAGVNQAGQVVKGTSVNAGPGTRTNVAYGALSDAPDQVTVVLPTNGLIAVWYQATWQESVANAAKAAIFLGANQVQAANGTVLSPANEATIGGSAGFSTPLSTVPTGLYSFNSSAANYVGDATTGQIVGQRPGLDYLGGPCYIFAAAGTYAIAVMYKASSGSVTASSRKLWAHALSFG